MVMEYFPGSTLGEYVRRGERFDAATIVAIGEQLCGILDHVHSVHGPGLIMTDIQPDNLVWHRGILRLIDLGDYICKGDDHIGKLGGTPGFAAPELYEGRGICEATEVFAIGRILQYLLMGTPEHGRGIIAVRHCGRRGVCHDECGYIRALVRLIATCTCADINRRPACVRELGDRLSMILQAHSPGK